MDGQEEEKNCKFTVPKFREEASWPMRQSLRASKAKNTAESSSCAPNQGKVKRTLIPLAKAFTMVVEG